MSVSHLAYPIYRSIWATLDLIFPPTCGGCGKSGSRWCGGCRSRTAVVSPPFCEICGIPVSHGYLCPTCEKDRPRFTALRSWAVFDDPVRQALHRL